MPRVAFSAALSLPRSEPGTVPFDRVLLNDGGFYDPETGKPEGGGVERLENWMRLSSDILPLENFFILGIWGDPDSLDHFFFLTAAWAGARVGRALAIHSTDLYWGLLAANVSRASDAGVE